MVSQPTLVFLHASRHLHQRILRSARDCGGGFAAIFPCLLVDDKEFLPVVFLLKISLNSRQVEMLAFSSPSRVVSLRTSIFFNVGGPTIDI